MVDYQLQKWNELIEDKRDRLDVAHSYDFTYEIKTSEDFQKYLGEKSELSQKGRPAQHFSQFISSLTNLHLFTTTVENVVHSDQASLITWSGLQAVIESCRSPDTLQDTLTVFARLNTALPAFGQSPQLYDEQPVLHWELRNVFDAYTEFCIKAVQYLRPWPFALRSIWRYFTENSPKANLPNTKAEFHRCYGEFQRTLTALQHSETTRVMALQMTPAAMPSPSLRDSIGSMRFPIHTDRPLQNYKFSGREDVLIGIDSALRSSKSSSNTTGLVSCTIHGIGGVGKTQVALQYTYSYEDKFDAIFWLRAETVTELVRSYAMITEKLKRSMSSATSSRNGSQERESNLDVMEVREWLETTETHWLLVFDNVDSFNHIIDYIPRHATSGAILVTTQNPDFPQITQSSLTWPLLSLSRTEGTRLLFRTLNRDAKDEEEEAIASEISDFVGHLPLALTTIGGYIKATMTTVPEFLSSLLASNAIWEKSSGPGYADESTYSKSLSTVFDIAYKNLSADAQTLMNVMAFLNPDMIPEEMLLYKHTDPSLQFLSQKKSYYEIIRNLNVRQLVKREAPSDSQTYFSVHRSLQLSILHRLSQNTKGRQEAFMQAFALVRAQLPEASRIQASQPDAWHKYDSYVPQISSLRTHSLWPDPKIKLPVDFVQVLIDTGVYLWQQGLLVEGKAALETAEKCLEEVPLDDLDILFSDIDDVLGIIDDLTGISCRADSLRRRRRALQIRKIEHSRIAEEDRTRIDEVRLYNAEANLGCAYLNAEMFEEAETIFEDCLVQYKSWTTVEEDIPFEYAKYYNHIAFVRTFQGRHIEAIKSARRACDLQQTHGGPNAPLVQYNRFNLGNQLYHAGELEESLKINQECLRDRIRVCGKDNLLTLESYSEVGALLFELGRFDEARESLLQCFGTRRKMSWTREGSAMAHFRFSKVLSALGRDDEAASHAAKAEAARTEFLYKYKEHFPRGIKDSQDVHDQMIPIWSGRFTGRMKRNTLAELY